MVGKIVEETVGTLLSDLRRDANWNEALVFEASDIQRQPATLRRQVEAIDRYRDALESVTILDPACGSGAFLIHALEYLLRERHRVGLERERLSQRALLFDQEEQIREILSRNIYGVDIECGAESVVAHMPGSDPSGGDIAANQARRLRPAQSGHVLDLGPQKPLGPPPLKRVFVMAEQALYPAVYLRATASGKPHTLRWP